MYKVSFINNENKENFNENIQGLFKHYQDNRENPETRKYLVIESDIDDKSPGYIIYMDPGYSDDSDNSEYSFDKELSWVPMELNKSYNQGIKDGMEKVIELINSHLDSFFESFKLEF